MNSISINSKYIDLDFKLIQRNLKSVKEHSTNISANSDEIQKAMKSIN